MWVLNAVRRGIGAESFTFLGCRSLHGYTAGLYQRGEASKPTQTHEDETMTNDALGAVIICLPLLLWMVL